MSSTRLFVSNLPDGASESDLKSAFSQFGQIVNVEVKSKPGSENDSKKFAFITLSASNYEVESCIKHFSNEDFCNNRLYITRARESFLERLQRERQESQKKEEEKAQPKEKNIVKNPVLNLSDKLNPRKRVYDTSYEKNDTTEKFIKSSNTYQPKKIDNGKKIEKGQKFQNTIPQEPVVIDKKKQDADKKRMDSIKNKRKEFLEKQKIIKSGLVGIDKTPNKKVIFSDNDDDTYHQNGIAKAYSDKKSTLFDENDEDSGDEVNFEIKKQFEGVQGQKVLDLQSRYKSDKRFVLDERFIENGESEEGKDTNNQDEDVVDLGNADEKTKQLNILQDLLGVSIRTKSMQPDNQKVKSKIGMLRFDPSQPDHAKFLAPVEAKSESKKKTKKKKNKAIDVEEEPAKIVEVEGPKVEVSKEQFYKVSDTLKEALEQPATFSLRSLFAQNEDKEKVETDQEEQYEVVEKPKSLKVKKNPLEPAEKNPFVYDSSESEDDEPDSKEKEAKVENVEPIAVWKENLFFTESDNRLRDALAFFINPTATENRKERRELKSIMKKRTYNRERKNQMFQKKIGGCRKTMKKSYKKKS